jgi:hypothetical protein
MKVSLRKNLQITSVRSNANWNKIQIFSLLQDLKKQRPVINSYIANKFINSKNTLVKISTEISENKEPLEDKIESVILKNNISHSNICIENLPEYSNLKLQYLFEEPILTPDNTSKVSKNFEFIKLPKDLCENNEIRKEY